MSAADREIASLQNPLVKHALKMRKPAYRRESGEMLIEGYREILRAVDNAHPITRLCVCPSLFLGTNEPMLIERVRASGAEVVTCSPEVASRMSYRDRPDGLIAFAPQIARRLEDLQMGSCPLILVAVAIEKPGNLGTMLRSADATGVDAVLVCDPNTDIHNPNVVRASVGTLFTVPVVQCDSNAARAWLRDRGIVTLATTPDATRNLYQTDLTGPVALILGSEQLGLDDVWLREAGLRIVIPMRGQADSLNVASAGTLVLYEALRQREYSG